MIPDRERCLELMERYGMLENIVAHSLEVTKVALFLSLELNKKGQKIDLPLVEAASLLHDIAKTACLKTKEDHTESGYRLLKEIGYERVGEIVAQHVWLKRVGRHLRCPRRKSSTTLTNGPSRPDRLAGREV